MSTGLIIALIVIVAAVLVVAAVLTLRARGPQHGRELAEARGFPGGGQYEEQFNALSVHHAHHVHGYRRVHAVASARSDARQDGDGRTDTEDMRAAMVEARALFEDLVGPPRSREESRTPTGESHARAGQPRDGRHDSRGHLPWAFNRRHAKGS
ncbi:hypothetical protein [Streptomyces sp. NRRL B-24085]|uniref:hypothetical protein n=1 Tax=Streptomyces sp. NRRL B-24085 TaxID=1709476 RepID=UPI0006B3BA35|nr:hypothetical protein [Streptomyces sp. NRRL B-24085]